MRPEKRPEKKRPAKTPLEGARSETRKIRSPGRDAEAAIENPHELLGLVAGEANAAVIVEAARSRLARIREANGSEAAVKAFVIGQICRARAAMLRQARRDREDRRHAGPDGSAEQRGTEATEAAGVLAAG